MSLLKLIMVIILAVGSIGGLWLLGYLFHKLIIVMRLNDDYYKM